MISGLKRHLSGILSFALIPALVLSLNPSTAHASMVTGGLVLHLNGSLPSSVNATSWLDQSGNNYSATRMNGVTYDSTDGSFTFNGTNQYLNLGNILNFTSAFSIEVTFSPSSLAGNRFLVSRQNSGRAGNYFVALNGSKVSYYVESEPWSLLSSTTLTTGTKYTATHVYDSAKAITPYLNGVQDGTKTTFGGSLWSSSINLQIGAALNRDSPSDFFAGKIYSVKIYNRALSASEVLQNYNALAPDTTAPTFTSSSSFSVAENIATAATAATIRVSESATVTISSGADAARFNIARSETNTAIIRFNLSPNFEAPIDVGGNNVYDLTLTATDLAGNSGTQSITISVTDVVDTSAFNSLSLAGSATTATYRSAIVITANVTVPSRIRFVVNGKVLPGCASRLTSGTSSSHSTTCTWRPSNRGSVSLIASATPTGDGISSSTAAPIRVMVGNRTGNR